MLAVLYGSTRVLTVGGRTAYETFARLGHTVSTAWFSYPPLLGAITGLLVIAVLLHAARAGRVAAAPTGLLVLAASVVLGLALPFADHGLYYINVRFQILAGVLLSVVFLPSYRERRPARLAAATLGGMLALRLAIMLVAWSGTGPYLADTRALLAWVPPGTRLGELDAEQKPAGLSPWLIDHIWPADYHMPLYLAAISNRFIPGLFDAQGQQPLQPLPEEARTEHAQRILTRAFGGHNPRGNVVAALGHFDMILVAGLWRHAPRSFLAGHLTRLVARPGIGLYKVTLPKRHQPPGLACHGAASPHAPPCAGYASP